MTVNKCRNEDVGWKELHNTTITMLNRFYSLFITVEMIMLHNLKNEWKRKTRKNTFKSWNIRTKL